ncbi:MAG: alkaline phosphatase family protein [Vicinamibacterales bacterium]
MTGAPRLARRTAWTAWATAALLALAAGWPARAATGAAPPTLLVLVVVDQMRADYLARYGRRWTGGLRRLLEGGAVQDQTYYPYLNTVTCAGHATLATGSWPKTHGAVMNQWYDRTAGAVRTCTADPSVRTIAYGTNQVSRGHSAAALRVPTLAERLRGRWRGSRAVTISVKARSAIMMAGKGATAVTWHDAAGWQTSTAFGRPRREVAAALGRLAVDPRTLPPWERLLPPDAYAGADDGPGERPPRGWTDSFPHAFDGLPNARLPIRFEESPYSDAMLGAMAGAAIRDFRLGQRGVVDFLGVSFSATDLVGHPFGPDSHEVQDTLARLDGVLAQLLDTLDRAVGPGKYALALSADHGVAAVPEAARAAGLDAGRVPLGSVRAAVEGALADLGPGPHVAHVEYTQVYLTPDTRSRATSSTMAPALKALRALPGVGAAVWNAGLPSTDDGTATAVVDAVLAGHVPDRSGDLSVVPSEHWIFVPGTSAAGGDGTTHGSSHAYDQHVPLILFGTAFRTGHYGMRATPADAAPTLAATVGLTLDGIEGRVLREMLADTGAPPR